jgi:microcystin-dependent protein
MTFWKWSKTAASNGTADSTCPFPEGMAPSGLNDGTRGMMAAAAKYRDDIAGAIVTGGTSTAYTVSSNQVFDSLAHLDGAMVAFTPHATNGATVTLNVDGLGVKPLRSSPGVELPSGSLILGTPYVATYNNTDGAWYLRSGLSNPYNIPLGGGIDYWLPTAPNSAFVFPVGQAISRTTYATLFAAMGTLFGAGDGSTTFNLPDTRGRFPQVSDNLGGVASGRSPIGFNGIGVNGTGGAWTAALLAANLPAHTHSGTTGNDSPDHTHGFGPEFLGQASGASSADKWQGGGAGFAFTKQTGGASARHAHAFTTDGGAGLAGTAFSILPPTIGCNYILRII